MANLTETSIFEPAVERLETNTAVLGGENGPSNTPLRQLANRTRYLFDALVSAGLSGNARVFDGDLLDLRKPGFYAARLSCTNKPDEGYGHVFVTGLSGFPDVGASTQIFCQIYLSSTQRIYYRVAQGSVSFSGDWIELTTSTNDAFVPAGAVMSFARASAPPGWFVAEGQTVSRSLYPDLFAAIGTTFGAGDGSTTFRLPDLRGEFVRGVDRGRNVDLGRTLGSSQNSEVGSHNHSYTETATTPSQVASGALTLTTVTGGSPSLTGNTGGGETRPRNIALLYCIKY